MLEDVEIKTKYGATRTLKELEAYVKRTQNKMYKVLCMKEENQDWESFLVNIIKEFDGFYELFNNPAGCIEISARMEQCFQEDAYPEFRKNIFDILTLFDGLIEYYKR